MKPVIVVLGAAALIAGGVAVAHAANSSGQVVLNHGAAYRFTATASQADIEALGFQSVTYQPSRIAGSYDVQAIWGGADGYAWHDMPGMSTPQFLGYLAENIRPVTGATAIEASRPDQAHTNYLRQLQRNRPTQQAAPTRRSRPPQ